MNKEDKNKKHTKQVKFDTHVYEIPQPYQPYEQYETYKLTDNKILDIFQSENIKSQK